MGLWKLARSAGNSNTWAEANMPMHHQIWKYDPSKSKARAKVLPNFMLPCLGISAEQAPSRQSLVWQ